MDHLAFHFYLLQFKTRQKCDLITHSSHQQHQTASWEMMFSPNPTTRQTGIEFGRTCKAQRTWDPLLDPALLDLCSTVGASGDGGSLLTAWHRTYPHWPLNSGDVLSEPRVILVAPSQLRIFYISNNPPKLIKLWQELRKTQFLSTAKEGQTSFLK